MSASRREEFHPLFAATTRLRLQSRKALPAFALSTGAEPPPSPPPAAFPAESTLLLTASRRMPAALPAASVALVRRPPPAPSSLAPSPPKTRRWHSAGIREEPDQHAAARRAPPRAPGCSGTAPAVPGAAAWPALCAGNSKARSHPKGPNTPQPKTCYGPAALVPEPYPGKTKQNAPHQDNEQQGTQFVHSRRLSPRWRHPPAS